MPPGDGRDRLHDEIAAYYAGFGQPAALLDAFRHAAVLVPLTAEDRVVVLPHGGIDWLCVFTSIAEYARFAAMRDLLDDDPDRDREHRYHWIFGRRLREYLDTRTEPAGIAIDIVGTAPMAFPPDLTEHATDATGMP
ncbi:SseB family protein [Nocardia rhizosphaerae]|uniref:SseB family protein n=1 Tax=Nocardia rhizosphaerae TaxID=1691571 RepID=A0ABV8LCP5_9NOCA